LKGVEDMSEGSKFDVGKWLKGGSQPQFYERLSFLLIFAAVAMIWVGLLLGSFIQYTVFIAAFGALLLLPAIMIYIASQLMEKKSETATAHAAAGP